jgi:hypothetical protein
MEPSYIVKKKSTVNKYLQLSSSVVDRHYINADPDPNFHVDADQDPDPGWHQNYVDPTLSFTHVGKSDFFFILVIDALPVYIVLSFSSVSNVP